MDRQFRDVVLNWLRLDGKAGYSGSRLPATKRPVGIGEWIARARPVKFRPKMEDLERFGDDFEAWYKACCPSWRRDRGLGIRMTRESGQDWSSLAKFGPNGIVSFVAALAWWKEAVKKIPCRTPRERQDKLIKRTMYETVLDEIDYTFRSLREAGY
ncbi:hypothetical protein MPER_03060 [Moniliophthora perniciosa FA553]|nr:hypothetical protein MPER_03060 [Moniliophthora perniciosa FA553]